jgi:hypothetical protein
VYIRGDELLASEIGATALANLSGDFVAMRAHPGLLDSEAFIFPVIVVALESYHSGNGTTAYPLGPRDVSLDTGLAARVEGQTGRAVPATANLTLFGLRLTDLPLVAPPPSRSPLFPDDWVYVRADLMVSMNLSQGGPVQAIIRDAPLDPAVMASLGLSRLETLGAVGFVRGSVAEVQSALRILALVIAVVIGLIVYAAMSLEVHARAGEIAILRSLGASPATVARIYEAQALVLALAGAIVGCALGVVAAHAVVSFAPLLGLPNLVILAPPVAPAGLAFAVALLAAAVGGVVPSRRAAVLVRGREAIPS